MHGSRYAAALTVFARCHYDRRRHKRVRGRSTGRGQPSVTNVLPPKGVGGGVRRGEARRDDDDDEEEQAEQGADRGTPSLSYHRRPIGPRRHTARLFFLPLSRARQINTGECRRRTIDQKPIVRVRFVAPRPIASRIGLTDEGKGEGSARGSGWIGLRSILCFFKIAFQRELSRGRENKIIVTVSKISYVFWKVMEIDWFK